MPVAELGFIPSNPQSQFNLFFSQWKSTEGKSEGGRSFKIGDDVAEVIGVTHYVPEFDKESTTAEVMAAPRRRYPKTLRGWFWWTLTKLGLRFAHRSLALDVAFNYPVYDVDALKNHKSWIQTGDVVHVTEKIHGSNARYVFVDGVQYCGS